MSTGLGEFAKRCVEGTAKPGNSADVRDAFAKYTPGATWNGWNYKDLSTETTLDNNLMMYMDSYCLGKGFMGATNEAIPEKYLAITAPAS